MDQLNEQRYLEDFAVGQTFGSGRLGIDKERVLAFAAEFDPQPFHLDEAAARGSIFGVLAASGWHTGGGAVRLLAERPPKAPAARHRPGGSRRLWSESHLIRAGGTRGAGREGCRRPRPVRPDDELRIE